MPDGAHNRRGWRVSRRQSPRAFSAASDGYAYAWDLTTGKCTATFKGTAFPSHAPVRLVISWCSRHAAAVGACGGTQDTATVSTASFSWTRTTQWQQHPVMAVSGCGVRGALGPRVVCALCSPRGPCGCRAGRHAHCRVLTSFHSCVQGGVVVVVTPVAGCRRQRHHQQLAGT